MTTTTDPTPSSPPVGASSSELSDIWRAIGRLEGTADALLVGQQDLKQGQHELNRRVDRLFYTILAASGALIVAVFASRFVGS